MTDQRKNVVVWVWRVYINYLDGRGYGLTPEEHRTRAHARQAARSWREIHPGCHTRVAKKPQ